TMTLGRRLLAVSGLLTLIAAISLSQVLGEPARDKENERWRADSNRPVSKTNQFAEELAASKFAESPVVTYRTTEGETLFALQVKPALKSGADRPRDILVLVDTSASQAQGPLATSQKIIESLVASLGADDRVAVLTANVKCRDLGDGFHSAAD